jgi:nitroimidazol reductase NimA-like FMN-containing flavoprotein (pyridoxamine 5'-phosphate oxidase superfamily)
MKKKQIEAIMRSAFVCRLGILDRNTPYIVPLCFGYHDDTLYFHGSVTSRKYALIRKHPRVCFEFDILAEPLSAPAPCDWDMRYQSVIGFGEASMVEGMDEKRQALEIIAAQYDKEGKTFPDNKVRATAVFKVSIASMTGKQSGALSPTPI